ncbi:MAG: T9SS type A sorting domain-containing protein [Bacteroidia bacterium]|nr:T9SS type A sorting domain-containing protein [Bacteroidia bacterium]
MKKIFLILNCVFLPALLNAQGRAHNFLIGYNTLTDSFTTAGKGRLLLDDSSVTVIGEARPMFFFVTQANISDESGNLLIASNGCWIADATGNVMLNGDNLNPNSFTNDYCNVVPIGLPLPHGNIILPYPNNPDKYILFHQTGNYNANGVSSELYYSEIDLSLNGGLGEVTAKNQNILNDGLMWGLAACKHANGRDWWIIALRDMSTIIHKFLLDSSGINYMGTQSLGYPLPIYLNNATQPLFSPDGTKFAYGTGRGGVNPLHDVRLFNFDRCSGNFSGLEYIAINDSSLGWSFAFSPDSKYLYHSSFQKVYQFNTDTSDVAASKTTVAVNDIFYSPYPPLQTDFHLMYLAANGKIYVTSGNGVVDFHYINYPDSAGMACDIHLHALHLPCYSGKANVYHPNYYLGCDTTSGCQCLITGLNEINQHDFKFKILPNPTNGNIKIIYLLPQNQKGVFEVYDITGKKVFSYYLPQWSTLQNFDLSFLNNGIYQCIIKSNSYSVSKKLVIIK